MEKAFAKAAWIWRQEAAGKDEFCDFVTTFTVDGNSRGPYTLSIASDSNYTLYLGGQMAAFGQYADYPTYKVYDRVDVTPFVKAGENRLAVVVWYYGIDSQTYQKGEAGVIFEIRDGNGTVLTCSSAETLSRLSRDYLSGRGDLISGQLGPTYHYDMGGYDGFLQGGGEGFAPSRVVGSISTDFHLRPNQKLILRDRMPARFCQTGQFRYVTESDNPGVLMQYAAISYRYPHELRGDRCLDFSQPARLKIVDGDPGAEGICFIVDLGEETAGFLDFDMEVPEDCRMEVGFGEHLKDGRCRTSIRGFWCDFRLKAGRNTYLHTFRRFGCRYLQFFIHAREATVYYAGLRPTTYPLHRKDFRCGNLLRETIYKVCQNTLLQCLHEHYEDCPWREQALYTMDSRNQMLCGYYAFGEYQAARASLELISHGVRRDGLLMLCYPAGLDFPIPSFSCMYFVQMDEYIRHSGDTTLAAEHLDMLEALMKVFLAKRLPEGVIDNFYAEFEGRHDYWNFYEWTPTMTGAFGETERRLEAPLNAFLSLALGALANICQALGHTEKAAAYRKDAADLNRAIARVFYNPETGLFESFDSIHRGEYTTLTQALCMLCGAADEVDRSRSVILPVLETNGRADVGLTVYPNTLSMNAFRFDALLKLDREKYAPMILDELDRDYLYMLRQGATTFWETIQGADDFADAGSLCHGWSALPVYYYETLLGHGQEKC